MAFKPSLATKHMDTFSVIEERSKPANIKIIKIVEIADNEENDKIFRPQTEEEFKELRNSIRDYGLLEPIVVQRTDYDLKCKYRMISGHHRKKVMLELGFDEIPAHIMNFEDKDDEKLAGIHANTKNRKMTPLDYAKAIDIEKDILNRKNKISGSNIDVTKTVAENLNLSTSMVNKYNSLNRLIPELQEMIDGNKLTVRKGSELATLPKATQQLFLDMFKDNINSIESKVIQENKNKAKVEVEMYLMQIDSQRIENEKLQKEIGSLEKAREKASGLEEQLKKNETYINRLNQDLQNAKEFKPKELEDLKTELTRTSIEKQKIQQELNQTKQHIKDKQHLEKPSVFEYITSKSISITNAEKQVLTIVENLDGKNIEAFIGFLQKIERK